nr:RDD family protein [Nocardioides ochotonae]
MERRFHAAVLDLLVVALPAVALAYAAHRLGAPVPAVLGVGAGMLLVAAVLEAAAVGLTGSSPGRATFGIRTVGAEGVPVGAGAGLLRAALLAGTGVATLGAGLAVLGWTALVDPSGRRRGWHDRLFCTVVLDVRGGDTAEPDPAPGPASLVNLTTMRLLPAPAPLPAAALRPVAPAPGAPRPLPGEAGPSPAASRWRVSFDTGESFLVEGLTLVGSDPGSDPGSEPSGSEPVRRRVTLGDASVSPTHARLQVVAGGTLVLMVSASGTVLLRGDAPRELVPGRATTLLAHDRVRFGDHLMEVLREA